MLRPICSCWHRLEASERILQISEHSNQRWTCTDLKRKVDDNSPPSSFLDDSVCSSSAEQALPSETFSNFSNWGAGRPFLVPPVHLHISWPTIANTRGVVNYIKNWLFGCLLSKSDANGGNGQSFESRQRRICSVAAFIKTFQHFHHRLRLPLSLMEFWTVKFSFNFHLNFPCFRCQKNYGMGKVLNWEALGVFLAAEASSFSSGIHSPL